MAKPKFAIVAFALIVLIILAANLNSVLAPLLSAGLPFPLSGYGVVRISAGESFASSGGYVRISVSSDGVAPFFVVRVLVMLNAPVEADLVLDSISLDNFPPITISSFSSPKVVIIQAGTTFGEIITSLPDRLSVLLVKEPMGNNAISVSGGANNGIVFVLRFSTGAYNIGSSMTATALVTAPSNSTVTITLS